MIPLSCTVRGCGAPLHQANRSFVCDRGHAFDVARSGYVSLLQPQDRKSLYAGDSRAAVQARTELLTAGIGAALLDAVVARAATLHLEGQPPVVVELGCGSGDSLGRLAATREIAGAGIDLSTAAAAEAARRFPSLTWVVANADRRLPLLDASVDLAVSVHARRNPTECRRILRTDGFLLVAVPGPSDLIELRELVQGEAVHRDRVQALVAEHDACFTVLEQTSATQTLDLDRGALRNLLRGTYRGERLSESPRVQSLDRLTVTLASDIVLFKPRTGHGHQAVGDGR